MDSGLVYHWQKRKFYVSISPWTGVLDPFWPFTVKMFIHGSNQAPESFACQKSNNVIHKVPRINLILVKGMWIFYIKGTKCLVIANPLWTVAELCFVSLHKRFRFRSAKKSETPLVTCQSIPRSKVMTIFDFIILSSTFSYIR